MHYAHSWFKVSMLLLFKAVLTLMMLMLMLTMTMTITMTMMMMIDVDDDGDGGEGGCWLAVFRLVSWFLLLLLLLRAADVNFYQKYIKPFLLLLTLPKPLRQTA